MTLAPSPRVLAPTEAAWLASLRASRGFDAARVLAAKEARLAAFFRHEKLDAAVVGVSGGVDSALTLALLLRLRQDGVLRRVVGLLLPVEGRGATGQARATARGREVGRALGAELWEAPLGEAQAALVRSLERGSQLTSNAWAEGQALSVLRTPALYGAAALLQAHGYASLVVGTTNRDEGAYLGFFGKASDGMVDLQPLADLHKSEVRALALLCGVPASIVGAVPKGDVFDGRSDEEMLGASYDEIELFLRLREAHRDDLAASLRAAGALTAQHARNAHKYRVGQPSRTVDVLPRAVPGGATDERWTSRSERRPPAGALPGEWEPPASLLEEPAPVGTTDTAAMVLPAGTPRPFPTVTRLAVPGLALVADDVLTAAACARLAEAMRESGREAPVSVTGLSDPASVAYGVGSVRATGWAPALAARLWTRLAPVVPSVRFLGETDPTDWFASEMSPSHGGRRGHHGWRVVGLSPVLRFMRYQQGGHHLGHYDAGYDYGDGRRSLLSVVFYLTSSSRSGATRVLRDGQEQRPVSRRTFDDWAREARPDEVLASVLPRVGRAFVFDHRLCHDVARYEEPGPRLIIRADVVYEAIPDLTDAPDVARGEA